MIPTPSRAQEEKKNEEACEGHPWSFRKPTLPLATVLVMGQCGLGQLHTEPTSRVKPWLLYL